MSVASCTVGRSEGCYCIGFHAVRSFAGVVHGVTRCSAEMCVSSQRVATRPPEPRELTALQRTEHNQSSGRLLARQPDNCIGEDQEAEAPPDNGETVVPGCPTGSW